MSRYLLKRLGLSVVILLCVSFIVYTIMRCIPSSYIETLARERASQPGSKSYTEWLAQLKAVYGMDVGIPQGFVKWLGNVLRGDFGDSWYYNMPVLEKFTSVVGDSFLLGAIAFVLQLLIAIPLGIVAARRQYSRADYGITVLSLIGISLPSFFFATLLKLFFSVRLGWFDLYGKVGRYYQQLSPVGKFFDVASHLVLPVATLTIVSIGFLMRYTRTNMLEVLGADYIRTARAKGLPEKTVVRRHAFRNTLIPVVTLIGGTLPSLFSGAMITETLFQIPGIGYTAYQAMVGGDIPFSMFYLVFMAALTLAGTLIADILYAVVDPRVRIR